MLSEYEASVLTRQRAGDGRLRPAHTVPERNRVGTVLVALCAVAAVSLLYSAWSDQGRVSHATQVVPGSTIMNPVIHPAPSGHPKAALFLGRVLGGDADHPADLPLIVDVAVSADE